jgi:hypothetical protein
MSGRRDISDWGWTVMQKVLLPALFASIALIGNIALLFNVGGELRVFFLFWSAITVLGWWYTSRLKWVSVDENFIYASGLRKKIRIPLSGVESVGVSYMQNPKWITLRLKAPSEFGSKIAFIPSQQRWFESMREGHPLADELRAMVRAQLESRQ